MMSEAPGWKYRLYSLEKAARLSPWFLGVDVASAQDGLWGCHHLALLYLPTKYSHVGADVDRLACHLHCPMICG
jgi:hypothetical protein